MSPNYKDAYERLGRHHFKWADFLFPTAWEREVGKYLKEKKVRVIKEISHNEITYAEIGETSGEYLEEFSEDLAKLYGIATTNYEDGSISSYRFTSAADIIHTEVNETDDEASYSELAAILEHDGPTKLASMLKQKLAELTPPSWDNQVDYGKGYLVLKLLETTDNKSNDN